MSESASGEAFDSSSGNGQEASGVCPTCGESFKSERGMKIHHKRAHNESIAGVDVECPTCGGRFSVQQNRLDTASGQVYCSRECRHSSDSAKCEDCGQTFESQTGLEIHNTRVHEQGTHRVYVECEWCGDDVIRWGNEFDRRENIFCSVSCKGKWQSKHNTGENHPRHKGKSHNRYYGPNWDEQRAARLEHDGCECVVCGMTRDAHKQKFDQDLHLHHLIRKEDFRNDDGTIDYGRANRLENLVTLCNIHHREWEGIPLRPQ